jgi:hypothetical protein
VTKIAVYGDSFAYDTDGWPTHFAKFLNGEVTNFALYGSSAEFSYTKFLNTHENFDIVVFLWTDLQRSALTDLTEKNNKLSLKTTIQACNPIENMIDYHLTCKTRFPDDFSTLNDDISDWMKSEQKNTVNFPNKNFIYHCAMKDSVKFKRPDSINVECFGIPKVIGFEHEHVGIFEIQSADMKQFTSKWVDEDYEVRKNHLSKKQNVQFAVYLCKALKNKNFNIHDTFKNPKKYYTMSKTIEESGFIL